MLTILGRFVLLVLLERLRRCIEFVFLGCLLLLLAERDSSEDGDVDAVEEESQQSDSSCCCFCSFLVGRRLRRELFLGEAVLEGVALAVGALLVFTFSDD